MSHTIFAFDCDNFEPAVIHVEKLENQRQMWVAIINHFDPEANVTEDDCDDYDSLMLQVVAVVNGNHPCALNDIPV